MRNSALALSLILTLLGSGCVVVPDTAPRQPWADPPTVSLEAKATIWEKTTLSYLNEQGLLLYSAWDPKGWRRSPKGEQDYLDSHDIADAPAWQGRLMASLALLWAVDGRDRNAALERTVDGLLKYYEITGEVGLIGRSYVVHNGERLAWMETQEQRPTKYWKKGNGGYWRTGLAKNHLLGAVLGCGIPLALHEQGKIALTPAVRAKLVRFMVPIVERLARGNYRIIGYDGKPTEFGDLRPSVIPQEYIDLVKPFVGFLPGDIDSEQLDHLSRPLNGFNMILVLSMLRSAAPYSDYIKTLYEQEAPAWASGVSLSLRVLGQVVGRIGHAKLGKPSYSDMEAVAFAASGLLLMDPQGPASDSTRAGLKGLWTYMKYERNPAFSIPYAALVDPAVDLTDVWQDLRDFPLPDNKVGMRGLEEHSDTVQPLANRQPKSYYWKSSPFEYLLSPFKRSSHPDRGSILYYAGQDYLVAYSMARFWKLTPR